MCRRSPKAHAPLTGAAAEQTLEGIDPGRVAITPLDLEAIRAHEGKGERPDIGGDAGRIKKRSATHLLYAAGARAGQTEVAGWIKPFVAGLVPLDAEAIILAVDGVGDGVHEVNGYGLWAMGSQIRNPPTHRRVSEHRGQPIAHSQ